jgi:predicted PolB exonuclease-like 3'-5' exonuclease
MLKLFHDEVWAFDAEWVPDPVTGRAVYGLVKETDGEVIAEMWRQGGATPEEPRPYLKTILCRVASISVVMRKAERGKPPRVTLFSLPQPEEGCLAEAEILDRFLGAIGKSKPQLVGFNSQSADLKILVQRALVHRLHLPMFCERQEKNWLGPDYFHRDNDYNLDLRDLLCGWGGSKSTATLHEIASACGIPGKIDTNGSNVIDLWLAGDIRRIVQYNECDALSTYLLWLRLAHLAGCLKTDEFTQEEAALEQFLRKRGEQPGHEHLLKYLDVWQKLSHRSAKGSQPNIANMADSDPFAAPA